MSSALRWWLGRRWKAELVFTGLFVVGIVVIAGGFPSPAPIGVVSWTFLICYLAIGLEFDPSGGWGDKKRPDQPTGRVALAGAVWALAAAGIFASAFDVLLHPDYRDDLFVSVLSAGVAAVLPVITIVLVAHVPRPANWVRQFNEEHRARIVTTEQALVVARTQVLLAQMQPHFLFNALNTVSALLRDDPARGRDVLLKLRGLLERSWRSSDRPVTTVEEELSFVRDQLAVEQERFGDRVTVDVSVAPGTLAAEIPAFSLQPLVENALRHGIARSIEGGRIGISVRAGHGSLVMIVSDSSGGLDPQWTEGTGLRNLRDRLEATYGNTASLSLRDEGGVTLARVEIPYVLSPRPVPIARPPTGSTPAAIADPRSGDRQTCRPRRTAR